MGLAAWGATGIANNDAAIPLNICEELDVKIEEPRPLLKGRWCPGIGTHNATRQGQEICNWRTTAKTNTQHKCWDWVNGTLQCQMLNTSTKLQRHWHAHSFDFQLCRGEIVHQPAAADDLVH